MEEAGLLQRRQAEKWGECLHKMLGSANRGIGRELSGEMILTGKGKRFTPKIIT